MHTDRRVLSIQSHVVYGYVGNKSATFPMQLLEFEVDQINSVQLSNHTSYSVFPGQILDAKDLHDLYGGLSINGLNKYSHLLTGYIGSKSFLLAVAEIIKDLKRVNPNLIYVCDPVLGDEGKMYVPDSLIAVYRDVIISSADILTPNQFEAELLTGMKVKDIESTKQVMMKLHDIGARVVILSSCDFDIADQKLVAFASVIKDGKMLCLKISVPRFYINFTGTGDLFTALVLAWSHVHQDNLKLVLETVMSTMHAVLKKTVSQIKEKHGDTNELSSADIELKLIQCKRDIENPELIFNAEYV